MSAEDRMANVVPKEVEHSEAPAEKPANGLGYNVPEVLEKGKIRSRNEKAMGIKRPTVATEIDI
jgi:hypothetical protein